MSNLDEVQNIQDRSRFFLTVAAITVSVLLFACGGDRKTTESADVPVRPGVSEASVTQAAPPPPAPPHAVAAPQAAAPQTHPEAPAPAPAFSETSPRADAAEPPLETGGGRVFSNKDLRRYTRVKEEFGPGRDVVTVDLTPKPQDTETKPGAAMTDEQREEEVRDTMQKINELNTEAAYLKSRIPSLHNPFLARVTPSEADAMAEAGMDNAQRLDRVNARLSQVDSQLNQLQRRLAELHQPDTGQKTP